MELAFSLAVVIPSRVTALFDAMRMRLVDHSIRFHCQMHTKQHSAFSQFEWAEHIEMCTQAHRSKWWFIIGHNAYVMCSACVINVHQAMAGNYPQFDLFCKWVGFAMLRDLGPRHMMRFQEMRNLIGWRKSKKQTERWRHVEKRTAKIQHTHPTA